MEGIQGEQFAVTQEAEFERRGAEFGLFLQQSS